MRKLTRLIYNVAFLAFLLLSHFVKRVVQFFALLSLKLQAIRFRVSKSNLRRRQQDEYRRLNDRLLKAELSKYKQSMESQKFYMLAGMIDHSFNKNDLKRLSVFYEVLFETPKHKVLEELNNLLN
jgi:hypothetical protein